MLKCLPKDIRFFGVSFDQQLCTSSLDKVRERERKRKEISFVDKKRLRKRREMIFINQEFTVQTLIDFLS